MIRLQRHELGPRVHVLGRRIHEWQVGAVATVAGGALWLAADVSGRATLALVVVGLWLLVKDWRDIFPGRRDTTAWALGVHRHVRRLRSSRRGDQLAPFLALAVGMVGVINLVSTLTPNVPWRGRLLQRVEPVTAIPLFHALVVPISVAVILTAFYLARRRFRAWCISLVFLVALGALDLLKGLDAEEALLTWVVAALLWWGRDAFYVRHDPIDVRSAAWRVPAAAIGAFALAVTGAAAAAPDAGAATIVRQAGDLVVWSPGPIRFTDELTWIPLGIGMAGVLALVIGAYAVFRPLAAPRNLPSPELRRTARELVRRHGTDTLAYFKLRRDTDHLFTQDRQALVGYRIENGVLLVSGDPVGAVDALPSAVQEVTRFAEMHGLELAALGASEASLSLWRDAGLRSLYIGDEAIVDTRAFSLEGRSIRKVRQSVSRLEKAGYTTELLDVADLDERTLAALERVSADWRAGAPERGFTMALDSLRSDDRDDGAVLVARDSEGRVRGFLHFVPTYDRPAMSLAAMRRERETPNGLTEFLVVRAIGSLRERGIEELSLNFAAFARLIHTPRNSAERLLGRLAAASDAYFQIESLYRFNAKFSPRWEPRYLVYQRARRLARVGLAALWVEGQLPKPGLRPAPVRPDQY
jgi:lysyl-tRNA synthetase class 2